MKLKRKINRWLQAHSHHGDPLGDVLAGLCLFALIAIWVLILAVIR